LLYQLAVAANPLYIGTWNDVPNRSRRSAAAWKLMAPLNASMDASIAAPNRAADKRRPALLAVRAGQTKFRRMLFGAAGMRCEVTGCDIPGLLDACHVKGYGQSGKYSLDNGLLLRKDIHALLDRGLLRIQPTTQRLIVDRSIAKSDYARLKGKRLAPRLNGDRVSERALNHLWKRAMNAARA
jgi:predicted restriction endonuclease